MAPYTNGRSSIIPPGAGEYFPVLLSLVRRCARATVSTRLKRGRGTRLLSSASCASVIRQRPYTRISSPMSATFRRSAIPANFHSRFWQVILAEPVGSCTDLAATVVLPLERMYQARFTLAPLTIAADARRLLDFVRQDGVRALHDDITYLFAKQIEEAELLLLNKCDLLPESGLTFLRNWLLAYLPGVQVLPVSGRTGEGLAAWVERFLDPPTSQAQPHQVLDLDYTRYGRAEARLGWLNASGILGGDAAALAQDWADGEFDQAIKASVSGPAPAVISWDTRDTALKATVTRWILNARIDTSPDRLEKLC